MRITAKVSWKFPESIKFDLPINQSGLEVQRGNCWLLADIYAKGERLNVEEFEDAEWWKQDDRSRKIVKLKS